MNYTISLLLTASLLFTGCRKYLDLQPQNAYTEVQVFNSEKAIDQALNGLYQLLASNSLYGANLTWIYTEMLGQNFIYTGSNLNGPYNLFLNYNYTDPSAKPVIDSIWSNAYTTILRTNSFLHSLQTAQDNKIITPASADLLRGEAQGIRALLHFDLLRLFGPVYAANPQATSIPYYSQATAQVQPLLPANVFLDSVIADLRQSVLLLSNDPILSSGLNTGGTDFYSGSRNRRLNYFAAKGILARAYLYGGYTLQAHDTAKALLSQAAQLFPWSDYSAIVGTSNPDRIFSPEVIFCLENPGMYTNYNAVFNSNQTYLLTANIDHLQSIFEYNENDYRFTTTWLPDPYGNRNFYKYADANPGSPWRFLQPMLRKSELYYILAETEQDPDQALQYLNTVRYNRGLTDLDASADLPSEIQKEYQKEFFGEGQVFFYYKRLNIDYIPYAVDDYDVVEPIYTLPLPDSETEFR